jgi:hypothetical protein
MRWDEQHRNTEEEKERDRGKPPAARVAKHCMFGWCRVKPAEELFLAHPLQLFGARRRSPMFRFLMNVIRFRLGQKAGKKVAKRIGLRWMAKPIGLITGVKATR